MVSSRFRSASNFINTAKLQKNTDDKLYKIRPSGLQYDYKGWRATYNLGETISNDVGMLKW